MCRRTNLEIWFLISTLLLAMGSFTYAGQIIYVDADANGLNDGSSWTDAYNFLQDALADANSSPKPVEIRVAQGSYTPDSNSAEPNGTGDRTATFQLIIEVTLKGGYAGVGQPDPNVRDINKYKTILSGDINTPGSNLDNSYHVVTGSCAGATTTIDGFTIIGGNASEGGAGIYLTCIPYTDWPSGICPNSKYLVTNCSFIDNVADSLFGQGGGAFIHGCTAKLTNCTFNRNFAGGGGGLCTRSYLAPPWLESPDTIVTLVNCAFIGNSARSGAGMYNTHAVAPTPGLEGSRAYVSLINCLFTVNIAENYGGGMSNFGSYVNVINCTFSGNSAEDGNSIACDSYQQQYPTNLQLINCILWDGGNEIWNNDDSTITVTYSDVQDGWPGEGNIDADPCFADTDANDYHLKSQAGRWDPNSQSWIKDDFTSPCIDAGDMASPIGYEPFPNGGIINIGAYGGTAEASKSYFGEPICETIVAGDINGDCIVNFKDFTFIAYHWLEHNNP